MTTDTPPALARGIVRYRGWIAAAWALALVLLAPPALRVDQAMSVSEPGVEESQATWVERTLATEFGSPFATSLVLVATGLPAPSDTVGAAVLRELVDAANRDPAVVRTLSYLDTRDSTLATARGTYVVVGLAPGANPDSTIIRLRGMTATLEQRLRQRYPEALLAWTGAAAFNYDVRLAAAAGAAQAERRVLPVTLLLLAVVFGGLVAAVLPVTVGVAAIVVSLGTAALLASVWPLTILLRNIVSMLGLGLGIDYALLAVSRFREARAEGSDPLEAAATTAWHAGHTVLLSGGAVAIGFAALLLVPATELRSLATGGLLVTGAAVLLATTLLPGLLAWLGARVGRGLFRRKRVVHDGVVLRRWGTWVADHPVLVLCVGALPMAWLAWQARRVSTDIPSGSWLPETMESTRAAAALVAMGKSGEIQVVRVVVELPEGAGVRTSAGWRAVHRLSRVWELDERVAAVRSLPLLLRSERPAPMRLAFAPDYVRNTFLSRDSRLTLIEVVPVEGAGAGDVARYVRELRATDAGEVSGLMGTRLHVGGLPAFNADYQDAIGGSVGGVLAVIVGGSLVALLVGFRSVLIPIKAVALNLFSVAAAFGAAVVVFQDGVGARWVGLDAPVDGLFPAVPIIVFSVVFGLSMDYEVFLVARVAEGVRRGMSDRDALIDGLSRTGGVITSAALVMIVVFAGFAAGDFLIVKILGFTLAVAVLLDATVVRLALGPALLRLAGRWNWWPGHR